MVNLSLLSISASSSFEERDRFLCLAINLAGLSLSQYCNYNFRSFCKIGDTFLGACREGLYVLEDPDMNVDAYFELPSTDFGLSYQKRLRSVYFGCELEGDLKLKVYDDGGNERAYTISGSDGVKVSIGRDGKGRYWKLRIENDTGYKFEIDKIGIVPVILGRKPGDY